MLHGSMGSAGSAALKIHDKRMAFRELYLYPYSTVGRMTRVQGLFRQDSLRFAKGKRSDTSYDRPLFRGGRADS